MSVEKEQEWSLLSPFKQIRLRTEMYFGSRDPHTQTVLEYTPDIQLVQTTWVPAVFTAFREILDNALDEVITHGFGSRIDVTYDPIEMIFSVADNGRGIPIEWSKEHNNYAATVLLSQMNSGRNFAIERGEARGLNGVGAKGVNYCSKWFDVNITRGKKNFTQQFYEGDELQIGLATVAPVAARKTGTAIKCKLSNAVFPSMMLPERFVAARMQEIAICYPKLHLTYNGQRIHAKTLFKEKPIQFIIDQPEFKATFSLVPGFVKDGGEFAFSLVNAIPLFNGGTHIDTFRKSFYSGLLSALERESKRRKLTPNRSDVSDGLLLYAILEMSAPCFDSQSKSRLINENVAALVRKMLDAPEFFKDAIKKSPEWIDSIYMRCAERTQAKDNKDATKQAKKNLRQKIEDLEDACGPDRSKCILFLTEGKSAVSGIAEARDSAIHGALPMRGKILNVHGEPPSKALGSEALAKVMSAVGLVPGQRANRYTLRYGSIAIAADADEDGRNISCLLVNFFYRYWPELFDPDKPPFIYLLDTPLIVATKGKIHRFWYNDDVDKFDPEKYKGWEIIRAKGLAALTKDDWKIILKAPQIRPILDDGGLAQALDTIFSQANGAADRRKEWIGM
jgi:DNA gyrase/topoisomerase IV subunit B